MPPSIECPRCKRTLEYSREAPNYCWFCGQRLSRSSDQPIVAPIPPSTHDYSYSSERESQDGIVPHSVDVVPKQIGSYRLLNLLGSGGMGRVYLGESVETGQRVAVKLLSSQSSSSPTSVERFRQEGRLASQISHPRCVFVFGADTDQGRPYIVMELMPGTTLKDLVDQRGPLPPLEAIGLMLDVVDGLQEAHRLGVIHRDVKPSNCFLMPDGHVKIGDFGLSKSLSSGRDLTQTGAFLGTVLYASPEQIRGQDVDYASDVYSVSATLFYLVTGRAPFDQENITAALARIISEDAPKARTLCPELPRALDKVIAHGLERERAWRIQTLDELRASLIALIPNQLSFGGLGVRFAAYVLDLILVQLLLILPLEGLIGRIQPSGQALPLLDEAILLLYFVLLEGLWGASLGKRLLRLRVYRAGTTDPPGIKRTLLRTAVFGLLVILTLTQPFNLITTLDSDGVTWNLWRSLAIFFGGLLVLIVPMRRSNDYRGFHEWISGTCVMRLPPRRSPIRLRSRMPNRLDAMLPALEPLPAMIGAYVIRSTSGIGVHGERVVLGEDTLLGRRVVIRLRPSDSSENDDTFQTNLRLNVSRPTRLRGLNGGKLRIGSNHYRWEAYVAPLGAPLQDIITPRQALSWPTARPLLEQLTDELLAAEQDGTLPETLDLAQVWVHPEGQLQLLDFAIPPSLESIRSADPTPNRENHSLRLIGEVASLTLEGQPRTPGYDNREPIQAPIPSHAEAMLRPLIQGNRAGLTIRTWRQRLRETEHLPTAVTIWGRLGQMGLQALFLLPGVLLLLTVSGLFGFFRQIPLLDRIAEAKTILIWQETAPELGEAPHNLTLEQLSLVQERLKAAETLLEERKRGLNFFERFAVVEVLKTSAMPSPEDLTTDQIMNSLKNLETVRVTDRIFFSTLEPMFSNLASQTLLLMVTIPLIWAMGAWFTQGGLSFQMLGYRLMTLNGRPAPRRLCAMRVLLTWLPMVLILCLSIVASTLDSRSTTLRTSLWLVALISIPIYACLAIGSPTRAPVDRILKLCLVTA